MEDKKMRRIKTNLLGGLTLAFLVLGCSIKAPEVKVTGEKTALEREVVGTYHQMEEDTWMIASTRAEKGEGKVKISPEKQKVLEALQEQKFNKDDIDEFKRKEYVGENNQGYLEIRTSEELTQDPEKMKFVNEIVQEENNDREIIMGRVIELKDSLKKAVKNDVLAIFAQMNQDNSPEGTWIQLPDGRWLKK
jgi:uncharacterized protein YdbL (DUF1318 family)